MKGEQEAFHRGCSQREWFHAGQATYAEYRGLDRSADLRDESATSEVVAGSLLRGLALSSFSAKFDNVRGQG